MSLSINESNIDEFNTNIILDSIIVKNYFWHINNTIFDVEFNYNNDLLVMVSFSKNRLGNWWEQKHSFWDNFLININEYDNNKIYYNKLVDIKKIIKNKILSKAFQIYEQNKMYGNF